MEVVVVFLFGYKEVRCWVYKEVAVFFSFWDIRKLDVGYIRKLVISYIRMLGFYKEVRCWIYRIFMR